MMRNDEMVKNVEVLNLTRNCRLCYQQFDREKVSTDGYASGDPVYFAWNNWWKPQKTRKTHICKAPDERCPLTFAL